MSPVQALLLMLQYSQGTQRAAETWRLMSHVVEGAFQIGLHHSNGGESLSVVNHEIRKRTWWMYFMMDKYMI